jgi:hypothetical protein
MLLILERKILRTIYDPINEDGTWEQDRIMSFASSTMK